jgi:hypothetical protein
VSSPASAVFSSSARSGISAIAVPADRASG